jgi:hypothetical protein
MVWVHYLLDARNSHESINIRSMHSRGQVICRIESHDDKSSEVSRVDKQCAIIDVPVRIFQSWNEGM